MRRQLQRMRQRKKRTAPFATQFIAIGAIATAHECRAPHRSGGSALLAVRQPQRMPKLMTHTTDEDAVILPQRNAAILSILQHLILHGEQVCIQQRRVHLPRRATAAGAAGVVGAVMPHRARPCIPVCQIAKDDDRFLLSINARPTQRLQAILLNVAPILWIGLAAFRRLQAPLHHVQLK